MTACSLRDILVTGRDDQAGHDERACRIANEHLDAVLVHSDPRFARLEETFGPIDTPRAYRSATPASWSAAARPARRARAPRGGLGRRRAGRRAAAARRDRGAADRHRRADARDRRAADARRRLRAPARGRRPRARRSSCVRSVPDLAGELAAPSAAVSQGGYNTDARDRPRRSARPRRAVRDARGGRAAAARAPARAARRAAGARARPARRRARSRARSRGCSRLRADAGRRSTSTAAAAPAASCGS